MAKKYVILSTDDNVDYYSLLPITCYSWKKLGYIPIVVMVFDTAKKNRYIQFPNVYLKEEIIQPITSIKGVKDSTAAQISRLFAATLPYINDEDIIVTGDADMVIGDFDFCDFTDEGKIVSYGFDLTGHSELPICYVMAKKKQWIELMQIKESNGDLNTEIERQLPEKAYSDKWEDYWSVDQQLLTQRAKEYGFENILFVNRGTDQNNHGLPYGRWDRHKWENIPAEIVDVHMVRNNLDAQVKVFETLWPEDNITWLKEFHEQLKQL